MPAHPPVTRFLVFAGCVLALRPALASDGTVRYNRDIRPILAEHCFACHGPDDASREAGLLLHEREDAVTDRGGYRIIAPGQPAESELLRRVTAADPAERMPPEKPITQQEISLLRRWIRDGAAYERHWSFIPPSRPQVPQVNSAGSDRNAVDAFVSRQLQQERLQPAGDADRAAQLRRVTLALSGLPPTLEELDHFLADPSPAAFEKAVDRLLASPRYGEHQARYWLDAARYADTNGYFTDDERTMWRWRDWVIDAFNQHKPFDQFTVEQLAGDLLPNPTVEQQIATGFNRNHMTMYETGAIDEEYRVEYVADRLNTTATVWMGLTVGCARCHDHKFDPISQQEFYRLFAFFNTVEEKGIAKGVGNAPPILEVPSAEFLDRLEKLRQRAERADTRWRKAKPELDGNFAAWLDAQSARPPRILEAGLVLHRELEGFGEPGARTLGDVRFVPGMLGNAARFDGDSMIEVVTDGQVARGDAFSYGAWIWLDSGRPACVLSKNSDLNDLRGFDLLIRKGKATVHLVHKWNSDAIQIQTKASVARQQWQHVMVTYDGSKTAAGMKIYLDGQLQEVDVRFDRLRGSIQNQEPLRIGRRSTSAPFIGLVDEVRIYSRELSAAEVSRLVLQQLLLGVGEMPPSDTEERTSILRRLYIAEHAPPPLRRLYSAAGMAKQELAEHQQRMPSVMVMREAPSRRKTFVLRRGQYDDHGASVPPGFPAVLSQDDDDRPRDRLALARWLVDPRHPLTARVTVNRFWSQLFGVGLVRTVDDFGYQGEWPSHPELLDWLARELVSSGWDLARLQRSIVTSATYRRSARVLGGAQRDRENRLLSRGPRFRADAETVRDIALATSGLLVERIGGPSVRPYQPDGLWEAVSFDGNARYEQDQGESLFRRGLYTFWKRQSPPPAMLVFDAPTRETCVIRRPRTNTPLQALTLLNDPTYVEAARALAERIMTEGPAGPAARTRYGFRLVTSRWPAPREEAVLREIFQQQLADFRHRPDAAIRLLEVGESPRNNELDTLEHAAYTVLASVMLNLDEAITQ